MLFIWVFGACTAEDYNSMRSYSAGNSAPSFFHFTTSYDANHYMFNQKSFDILMAKTKKDDWIKMKGWNGVFNKTTKDSFTLNLEQKVSTNQRSWWISYHISVLASGISEYNERDDAIDKQNVSYIEKRFHKYQPNTKVSIENHGKENYSCVVLEYMKKGSKNIKKQGITYRCYKFNPSRTKAKDVTISLTYTKDISLPTKYKSLEKQYTYQDLQQRAKRMLDSLFIKDGWQ